MKTIKTEKVNLTVQELKDKREKISNDLSSKSPEELKEYIAERLNQEKDKPA